MTPPKGPVLFDLDADGPAAASPATARPVPDADPEPTGAAMQRVASLMVRKPSRTGRLFWGLVVALAGFVLSVAAWTFVTDLLLRYPVLGWIAAGLTAALVAVLAVMGVRELAALSRLRRLDGLRADAAAVTDLAGARAVTDRLVRLYAGRPDTRWGRQALADRQGDVFDADGQLALAETVLLAPLDAAALREVEAAARLVATVTALVPVALADVFAALTANLRMIRRIAEIYGGRAGTLGNWRLTRSVLTHLVATGAVAVGDDLIGTVAGGGVLSKVSRRFGEGVVNGALTARVGVAALEVCRPLPFVAQRRPSVSAIMGRALTGLFGKAPKPPQPD
jgi:putative membrane protein